ncbi:cytochrome P450 [Nonomuraea sp. NPDC046802]|uniref:cytochrome P450 n=1 Tax=Nonomuraea sp. NPDC046802 TaxID=3154919 RepID=UPI0034037726
MAPESDPLGPTWAISLLDEETRRNPFRVYEDLHRCGAVGWNPRIGAWVVVGYAEARRVLSDHESFSSGIRQDYKRSLYGAPTMIFSDPPVHTSLRQALATSFSASSMRMLRTTVERSVTHLLDQAFSRGSFDFITDIAALLPVAVIGGMLGIPPEDQDLLKEASDQVVSVGVVSNSTARSRRAASSALRSYFADRIRERMSTGPKGDLLDAVCAMHQHPTADQLDVMVAACMLVLVAGHETSTGLLGNVALYLMKRPEIRDLMAADPSLVPQVVEEIARLEGPVQALRRWTPREVTDIGGAFVPADANVVVLTGAANRDPAYFAEPGEFSLDRAGAPPHLGFGWGGHYCLGARLARLEAHVLFTQLLGRAPIRMTVARDHVPYVPSLFVRGPAALPVSVADPVAICL